MTVTVKVELFGIPRARAGIAQTTSAGHDLGDVISDMASRFPELAISCIQGRHLKPGFTANLSGHRFVTDPDTLLSDGDSVLILSLDAGG
ncbi:MAG: MoaD/ThiS family protein [Schlesneria sp.]